MYTKPNHNRIMEAVYDGWSDVDAQRGYSIFDMNNTGILCIEKLDCIYYDTIVQDRQKLTNIVRLLQLVSCQKISS